MADQDHDEASSRGGTAGRRSIPEVGTAQGRRSVWAWLRDSLWSDRHCRSDYAAFLVFAAVPALAPLAMIWLLGLRSFAELMANGALYLVTTCVCGTLVLKSLQIERSVDRHQVHCLIYVVQLLAAVGFGLGLVMQDNSSVEGFHLRNLVASIVLLVVAVLPVGWVTSLKTSRIRLRQGGPLRRADDVIALESSSQEPAPDVAIDLDVRSEVLRIGRELKVLQGRETSGPPEQT